MEHFSRSLSMKAQNWQQVNRASVIETCAITQRQTGAAAWSEIYRNIKTLLYHQPLCNNVTDNIP